MSICAHCGHDNVEPDARFCANCGQPLGASSAGGDAPAVEHTDQGVEATTSLPLTADAEADLAEISVGESLGVEAATLERLKAGTALLVVRRGPTAGSRFLLDADVTSAGRHPSSDIFLDDVTVSRRHAQFLRDDGGFRVRDAGSLNGTYVNRKRIEDVEVTGGDEIQIGKYRLVFFSPTLTGGDA
jgi:pSer/pThr/pTyr-binding forkhead associated (FHA) protein